MLDVTIYSTDTRSKTSGACSFCVRIFTMCCVLGGWSTLLVQEKEMYLFTVTGQKPERNNGRTANCCVITGFETFLVSNDCLTFG